MKESEPELDALHRLARIVHRGLESKSLHFLLWQDSAAVCQILGRFFSESCVPAIHVHRKAWIESGNEVYKCLDAAENKSIFGMPVADVSFPSSKPATFKPTTETTKE